MATELLHLLTQTHPDPSQEVTVIISQRWYWPLAAFVLLLRICGKQLQPESGLENLQTFIHFCKTSIRFRICHMHKPCLLPSFFHPDFHCLRTRSPLHRNHLFCSARDVIFHHFLVCIIFLLAPLRTSERHAARNLLSLFQARFIEFPVFQTFQSTHTSLSQSMVLIRP